MRADKAEERRQGKETMQKDVKTAEERAGNSEKAAEQTKANPVAENAKKKAQEIA